MSRFSTSTGSGYDEDESSIIFQCRKCPGLTFTAAEKDAHRLMHKQEKREAKKVQRKERRPRSPSPAPSYVTLFENPEVNDDKDAAASPVKKPRREDRRSPDGSLTLTGESRSPTPAQRSREESPSPNPAKPPMKFHRSRAEQREKEVRRGPIKELAKVRRSLFKEPEMENRRASAKPASRSTRQASAKKDDETKEEKRKSKKTYDNGVIGYWVNGNGA